jgi:hypothetical protein
MRSRELLLRAHFFLFLLLSKLLTTLFFHNSAFIVNYTAICIFGKYLQHRVFPSLSKIIKI